MKDYSNGKSYQYGIIEAGSSFAIVEVLKRDQSDRRNITRYKPEMLSISKYISTLQQQIDAMKGKRQSRAELVEEELQRVGR